jgi:DNA-binding response OmpR family regulator
VNISERDGVVNPGATAVPSAVLVADDEPMVLAIAQHVLRNAGFTVYTAVDGCQAVAVFEAHAKEIGCAILDVSMPLMSGEDAARRIRSICPGVRILLTSGIAGSELLERTRGVADGCLQKPFEIADLCAKVKAMMARG